MKKTLLFLGAAIALVSSCSEANVENSKQVPEQKKVEITAYTELATKTGLVTDNNGGKSVIWKAGDAISLFFNTGEYGGNMFQTEDTGEKATFQGYISAISGDLSSAGGKAYFWGVYPYNQMASCDGTYLTTNLPWQQSAPANDVDNGLLITVGRSENLSLYFRNTLSVVGFTLSQDDIVEVDFCGNAGEKIAGGYKVSFDESNNIVEAPTENAMDHIMVLPYNENHFSKGVTYYFAFLPGVFSKGYTLRFIKGDGTIATYTKSTSSTFLVSTFYTMTNKDKGLTFKAYTDLSANETANSYIVSDSGYYKIRAVKGNSNSYDSPCGVSSAEVLWESFGTDTAPSVGDLVNHVFYNDGYVYFQTSDKKGNAAIAAKDDSGNILWSWHIWMTDYPEIQEYNNNAGLMMDRNLGAISATPGDVSALGLMYQYGRKDPFLGGSAISYSESNDQAIAASTITWPTPVLSDEATGTLEYSVAHPTTFITVDANTEWWLQEDLPGSTDSSADDYFAPWQVTTSNKGLYDPCPAGYRVPDGGENGVWATAFGSNAYFSSQTIVDTNNRGAYFGSDDNTDSAVLGTGSIWYPFTGYLNGRDGALHSCGQFSYYMANLNPGSGSKAFDILGTFVMPNGTEVETSASSVRCIAE